MPGPYTWADMTFLTPAERQGMQDMAALGNQVTASGAGGAPTEPISGIVPTATLSQSKAAEKIRRQLLDLWGPAITGTRYSAMWHRYKNASDYEAANP